MKHMAIPPEIVHKIIDPLRPKFVEYIFLTYAKPRGCICGRCPLIVADYIGFKWIDVHVNDIINLRGVSTDFASAIEMPYVMLYFGRAGKWHSSIITTNHELSKRYIEYEAHVYEPFYYRKSLTTRMNRSCTYRKNIINSKHMYMASLAYGMVESSMSIRNTPPAEVITKLSVVEGKSAQAYFAKIFADYGLSIGYGTNVYESSGDMQSLRIAQKSSIYPFMMPKKKKYTYNTKDLSSMRQKQLTPSIDKIVLNKKIRDSKKVDLGKNKLSVKYQRRVDNNIMKYQIKKHKNQYNIWKKIIL